MKLHQLLAIETNVVNQAKLLMEDAEKKFQKPEQYFMGGRKDLKMLESSEAAKAIELAESTNKDITTTVTETLQYALKSWVEAEDLQLRKNDSNRNAVASLIFREKVLAKNVPVDELLGLEDRLKKLRLVLCKIPTLSADKQWISWKEDVSLKKWQWRSVTETTVKTQNFITPIVMYPATEQHPAQIKEVSENRVVGRYETTRYSGAVTSQQLADVLTSIDELIVAVKSARSEANNVEVVQLKIGQVLIDEILAPLYS